MNIETPVINTEDAMIIETPVMLSAVDVAAIDINNLLRDGVLGLISEFSPEGIPVGGVLAKIIGLFWPESDNSQAVWNSIKMYAEQLVADAIDKERIEELSKKLEGLGIVADNYRNTSFGAEDKGTHLHNLLDQLRLYAPSFYDKRNPEKMFPLFSSFGTLWITALVEQVYMFDKIYPGKIDIDKAIHLKMLKDNIAKYTQTAQTTYDKLYEWRFSLLQIKEWQKSGPTYSESEWTFVDQYPPGSSISRSGSGPHGYHNPLGQQEIEAVASTRVSEINGSFVPKLQATLAVARSWQYLDPATPRTKRFEVTPHGPVGGPGGNAFADRPPRDTARITKIRVRHSTVVDCVELFYDGQSGGVHGNPQGGALSELDLAPDEYVVLVEGRAGACIDALTFTTNKGRTVGGGGGGGGPIASVGLGGWKDVSLFAISGRSEFGRLTQLTLQWKHEADLLPPYTPSYKREGSPILASSNLQLKAGESSYVSQLVEEYSGKAARYQYFPKMGTTAITLQLRLWDKPGVQTALTDRQWVNIVTTESAAGDYSHLGKYSANQLYYYTYSGHIRPQLWEVVKMIPSEGPVMTGEKVYLRNVETCGYLCPLDGYLGANWEPFAWDVVPVR